MSDVQKEPVALPPGSTGLPSDKGEGSTRKRDQLNLGSIHVAPHGATEQWLADVWREILQLDQVGTLDDFFELGGDSLAAIILFDHVERRAGARLAPSTIIDHPTVSMLAALLDGQTPPVAGRCLVPLETGGAGPPLFLFHEVSGQLLSYRHLLRRLAGRRLVYGLQHPDQDRDPVARLSFAALSEIFAKAIREAEPAGPYGLIGYSMGGNVAYETACRLVSDGAEVGLLLLIDAAAPNNKVRRLPQIARKLSRHLARLSDEEPRRWGSYLLGELRKELRRSRESSIAQPNAASVDPGQFPYLLSSPHRPSTYSGPLKILRCNQLFWGKWDLGWSAFATGQIEVFEVSGDHLNMMTEPRVALLTALLDQWLPTVGVDRETR